MTREMIEVPPFPRLTRESVGDLLAAVSHISIDEPRPGGPIYIQCRAQDGVVVRTHLDRLRDTEFQFAGTGA